MSYYYKYDFVSPEPVYSIVKEELKSVLGNWEELHMKYKKPISL